MTGRTTTTTSNGSRQDTKTSNESSTAVADILKAAKDELAVAYASASAAAAGREDEEHEKDSSSMKVLARPKKKHTTKQEGSESTSGRSGSSYEEELQLPQQPQQPQIQQGVNYEEGAVDQNEVHRNGQGIMDNPQQQPQQQQNVMGDAQRYGFPTMVSEYSSSGRNASSGASNTNMMSASGSGSGGNTGSGTGSGSNQGGSSGSGNGSSGSGNDQGGISSNGNGSSGSGNDKGSGEETTSQNMAEISKDGSDRCSPNNVKSNVHLQDSSNVRFSPNPSEPSSQRRLSTRSNDTESQNAAREKKLQDKKRKRMNMRRVYEDQMEQDMGSSDSNTEQGILCPGRPVTLDNAISFTTTAKLVVKSSPSLTVIYANAAYIRLSGIDSHSAVGNPITSFLSLPNQRFSKEYPKKGLLPENSTVKVNQSESFKATCENNESATASKNHAAAEAAGRARAAASVDDDITDELEKLIVASGDGKIIKINVRCKPHNMIGRNVKVFKSMVSMKGTQETGSDGSSITSSFDGPYDFVACTMTISPVVSSPDIYTMNTQMTTKERKGENHQNKARSNEKEGEVHQQKSKRRKHHHTMNEIIHNRKRQVISHYVIQLKPHEGDSKLDEAERGSHSTLSNGVEAGMLGLTKNEPT